MNLPFKSDGTVTCSKLLAHVIVRLKKHVQALALQKGFKTPQVPAGDLLRVDVYKYNKRFMTMTKLCQTSAWQ